MGCGRDGSAVLACTSESYRFPCEYLSVGRCAGNGGTAQGTTYQSRLDSRWLVDWLAAVYLYRGAGVGCLRGSVAGVVGDDKFLQTIYNEQNGHEKSCPYRCSGCRDRILAVRY